MNEHQNPVGAVKPQTAASYLQVLTQEGWAGPGVGIANKLPGDADAAGPGTSPEKKHCDPFTPTCLLQVALPFRTNLRTYLIIWDTLE